MHSPRSAGSDGSRARCIPGVCRARCIPGVCRARCIQSDRLEQFVYQGFSERIRTHKFVPNRESEPDRAKSSRSKGICIKNLTDSTGRHFQKIQILNRTEPDRANSLRTGNRHFLFDCCWGRIRPDAIIFFPVCRSGSDAYGTILVRARSDAIFLFPVYRSGPDAYGKILVRDRPDAIFFFPVYRSGPDAYGANRVGNRPG